MRTIKWYQVLDDLSEVLLGELFGETPKWLNNIDEWSTIFGINDEHLPWVYIHDAVPFYKGIMALWRRCLFLSHSNKTVLLSPKSPTWLSKIIFFG